MWLNTCGTPCSEGERIPWAPMGVSVGGCQKEPILGFGLWLDDLGAGFL